MIDSTVVYVEEDLQASTVRGGEDTVTPTLVIMEVSVITPRFLGWCVLVIWDGEEHCVITSEKGKEDTVNQTLFKI